MDLEQYFQRIGYEGSVSCDDNYRRSIVANSVKGGPKWDLMNDSRDLVSSRIQPRTKTAYLQTHNLSKGTFRLSKVRDFMGYVISIGVALAALVATCCWAITYEGRRKTAEISRAV